jgi:integrase
MRRRGGGEGSVSKRADGRFEGRFDLGIVNGKRKRVSVYGRTRREVQDRLRQRQTEYESLGIVLDHRLTVGRWLDHWVGTLLPVRVANGDLAQSTFANYADCVRLHLNPHLGHIRLIKLSPFDVEALIASKREKYSSNSLRLMRSTLRVALKEAQRHGLVIPNAATLSRSVSVIKQAERWLTVEEARLLLKRVAGDRLEALYLLCLSTGLRRGEALGLYWTDVDLDERRFLVRRAIKRVQMLSECGPKTRLEIGTPKTRSSVRMQLIPRTCIDVLKRHRAQQAAEKLASNEWRNSELVFTTSSGSPIDPANFAKWFSRHCIAAGLGHRNPHQLRHSTATILLAQGVPLHEVSEILGHSSVSVTKDVYGHLTTERRQAAADAMDAALRYK